MPEWRPGVLETLLGEITVAGVENQQRGMILIAHAIEAKAKTDLARTSHPRGTPSPAPIGGPPSLVSGTGRRSIGIDISPAGRVIRIGTLRGVYPPYGKTPSSKYLFYQEKGRDRAGVPFAHPFLVPAFDEIVRGQVAVWLDAFRVWPVF